MAESFDKELVSYRGKLKEIEAALNAKPEFKRGIRYFSDHGASSVKLAHGIAILVYEVQQPRWRDGMRRHARRLKEAAGELERLARTVDAMYADPMTSMRAWHSALTMTTETARNPEPEARLDSSLLIGRECTERMRTCAADLKARVKTLGTFLHAEAPRQKAKPLAALVGYVDHATGDCKPHLGRLAEMLIAAGLTRVTDESLVKVFERHLRPRPA